MVVRRGGGIIGAKGEGGAQAGGAGGVELGDDIA